MTVNAQRMSKPLPNWLFLLMFWLIIPPMIMAMMVWEVIIKPLWQRVVQ